jgi:branched-chain amino acid transport system permease protein
MTWQSLVTAIDDRYHDSPGTRLLLYAALVAAAAILPFLLADYRINLLINIAVFALIATAFNFAFGFAAVPSFGHAAFFAIGGYGIIMLLSHSESIPLVGDGLVVPVVITLGISILAAVVM